MNIWKNDYVCLLPFNITTKLFYHIFDSGINVVSSKQYDPLPIEPGHFSTKMIFLPTAVRNILSQVETALKEAENPMIFFHNHPKGHLP